MPGARGSGPETRVGGDRRQAARDAAPTRTENPINLTLPLDDSYEPPHASSPTDRSIFEIQLYGHRPFQDEPDPRPLPEEPAVQSALTAIFDAFAEMLGDTQLEPDLEDLLWSKVNLSYRAGDRIQRDLQRNEDAQRTGQREQDGTEVKSVELERLVA